MASETGMFLDEEERQRLIRALESTGDDDLKQMIPMGNDTGCLICGKDDDHNNLMLCEGCNDEYHTYCLDPPLDSVPEDDWYCDRCAGRLEQERNRRKLNMENDDGLAGMVSAMPREFSSRFGEVCFAYGGFGFGWWPSCIFDPRLTEGGARQTARKNLGKKHLIYFFECHEAPFAVLSSSKIVSWHEGLSENYHLGKTARAAGKQRSLQFQQALQAAVIEEDKPLEQRLDWNRAESAAEPPLLPIPTQISGPKEKEKKKKKKKKERKEKKKRKREGSDTEDGGRKKKRKEDGPLFCRIVKRLPASTSATKGVSNVFGNESKGGTNIGFVKLPSAKKSTFSDARKAIVKELVPDPLPRDSNWKFHITTLGPVSARQEESLGPILPFLRSGIGGNVTNGGSIGDPITVVIVES